MTRSEPHPQRCETCTNDGCDFNEDRWGSTWHNDIYYFMKKCGCASHSSATEPAPETPVSEPVWKCVVCGAITSKQHEHKYQEVLQAVREGVLNDIFAYMETNGVKKRPAGYWVVSGGFSLGNFIKFLESLRKIGGGRR